MTAPTVRRATPADAEELTRLRRLMYTSMGLEVSDPEWDRACTEHFRRRVVTEDFAAFVVDGPEGLLASGCGWVEHHLPSPSSPSGLRGHIASMSTDVAARRQGLGRLVMAGLLDWFASAGITRVDLTATAMGEPLYRSLGFAESRNLFMSRSAP